MSFVVANPETLAAAAANLTGIGSSLDAAHAAAAQATTAVAAAAGDEVSTAIASIFSSYAQQYQTLSAQVAAFHAEFVETLTGAGGSYAAAEAANASPLQTLEQDAWVPSTRLPICCWGARSSVTAPARRRAAAKPASRVGF